MKGNTGKPAGGTGGESEDFLLNGGRQERVEVLRRADRGPGESRHGAEHRQLG